MPLPVSPVRTRNGVVRSNELQNRCKVGLLSPLPDMALPDARRRPANRRYIVGTTTMFNSVDVISPQRMAIAIRDRLPGG
jgi:hypothetical protein